MEARLAVPSDIPELALMGEDFFKLTAYADKTTYDFLSIVRTIREMIKNGCVTVAVEDGDIKGFYGAVINDLCWNEDMRIANELFWWGTPKAMVMAFDEALRHMEGIYLCSSTLASMKPEVTQKFYEKRGFENMGNFYFKEIK